jgi:hypothetical protein
MRRRGHYSENRWTRTQIQFKGAAPERLLNAWLINSDSLQTQRNETRVTARLYPGSYTGKHPLYLCSLTAFLSSLHLTKHHAIKTYGGIARRSVVSFTPRPVYPRGKRPQYSLDRRLDGTQSRSERGDEKGKKSLLCPYRKWNHRHLLCSIVTVLTELCVLSNSGSFIRINYSKTWLS